MRLTLRGFFFRTRTGLGILNIQFSSKLRINGMIIKIVIIIHVFMPMFRKTVISGSLQDSLTLHKMASVVKIHGIATITKVTTESNSGCFLNFFAI